MKKRVLLILNFIYITNLYSNNLEIWSESAIVIDYETEYIIFEKNINEELPPASMTKLVTIFILYEEIKSGKITKETIVPISSDADWRSLPRESSLMFLEKKHKLTVLELMKGLAVSSGNDAAVAAAQFISGSVESFVIRMNEELNKLGFKNIVLHDPSGYSPKNVITALEYAQFCRILVKRHPESLQELFSLESYLYPKRRNGKGDLGGILQYNRNKLIKDYPGCDGLKTGYIDESGMNIAITAVKGELRVIAVIIGAKDKNKKRAETKRNEDAKKLLDYSFNNFKYMQLDKIDLPIIAQINIKPVIPYKNKILVNKNNFEIDYNIRNIEEDIYMDYKIGYVEIGNGQQILNFPIIGNKLYH